jgi:hypothetical protein
MADATFDKALLPDIEDWDGDEDVYAIEDNAILSDKESFVIRLTSPLFVTMQLTGLMTFSLR